jgi:hypothetical protein
MTEWGEEHNFDRIKLLDIGKFNEDSESSKLAKAPGSSFNHLCC